MEVRRPSDSLLNSKPSAGRRSTSSTSLNSGGLHHTTDRPFSERSFSCMIPTMYLVLFVFFRLGPHCIFSRTWRKYPMRPGLGRSLSPPRRLGGWGDPLGATSKWGRASSHDGDNMLRQARRYAACLLFSSLLQASGSGSVCHATCASTSWSIRFFSEGAMLTACLTQSRQLDRPADGIGR